jgi:hypothetical protein
VHIARIDHLVLTVDDVERTIAFYVDVLGMTEVTFGAGRKALTFGSSKDQSAPARSANRLAPVSVMRCLTQAMRVPPESAKRWPVPGVRPVSASLAAKVGEDQRRSAERKLASDLGLHAHTLCPRVESEPKCEARNALITQRSRVQIPPRYEFQARRSWISEPESILI